MTSLRKLLIVAAPALLLLAGCAGPALLDNTVQSFSQLPALPVAPTYRFERLPSQQQDATQPQLEALADPALQQAGLRRDDANARYGVQVAARVQRVISPWADPWDDWGWGWGWRGRHHRFNMGWGMDSPWFHREVSVIVRELSSQRVVFESHATNDGPWRDSPRVLPAMFSAAMQGFPTPPPGPRVVNVQLPPG